MKTNKDGVKAREAKLAMNSLTSMISTKQLKMISMVIVQNRRKISTDSATSLASQTEKENPDTATTQPQRLSMALSATAGKQ